MDSNNKPMTLLDIENAEFSALVEKNKGGSNMSLVKKEHEEYFELKPIGVRYICEFCGKGEMEADPNESVVIPLVTGAPIMRTHICNKCGKSMQLPKTYPYIEWVTAAEYDEFVKSGGMSNGSD